MLKAPEKCERGENTLFLAHLSTKCSGWAIVTGLCPSFVVRQPSSSLKPLIAFWPNFTGMIPRCSSTKVVQTVAVGYISTGRSRGPKKVFKMQFSKVFIWNYKVLYQSCSNYAPGVKIDPARGSQFHIELYKENFKLLLFLNRKWEFDQTQQEWSLGGPLSKLFKWFWLVA